MKRVITLFLILGMASIWAQSPDLFIDFNLSEESSERKVEKQKNWRARLPFEFTGFWDNRFGIRTQNDPVEKQASLAESRLHIDTQFQAGLSNIAIKTDFIYDAAIHDELNLNKGTGWIDLREASLFFSPNPFTDLKVGRQIITWGTGDLLFINDLFPKDWNSFFLGRSQDYLKAPSDALKASLYSNYGNLDIVYTPQFDSDRYINGNRVSFYNANYGRRTGRDVAITDEPRDDWFSEDEIAVRYSRFINSLELGLYYYNGYWKSPSGQTLSQNLTFNSLAVYGASVRSAFYKGLANLELGYYDSQDDTDGKNMFANNSELRFLVGYEQELASNLTGSIQYYLEQMQDYDNYKKYLPAGSPKKNKNRHVLTTRLSKRLHQDRWIVSLFNFYSPSDSDGYLRLNISHKYSDNLSLETGGNWFYGHTDTSFFAQFENNNNAYISIKNSF